MLLEIMLRRVLVHISIMETQQASTNGNFALDHALLANLVINNALKQYQKSVTDCAVTHSSLHKKLALIICSKLSMEDHVVSTR